MARTVEATDPVVSKEFRTERFQADIPRGGDGKLDWFRRQHNLNAEGQDVGDKIPWKQYDTTASVIAPRTFTRANGTTFAGTALLADIALVLDVLSAEKGEPS